ncbi:hypothetical protein LINGRAHAP2_LOCUS13292 [Linum grandiflorum]
MDSFTTASIILSSLIALQFLSQTTARPIADHIPACVTQFNLQKAVCNRSYGLDFNLCIETIRSDPKASTAVDVKALAKAVFKTAKEQSLNLSRTFDQFERREGGGAWKSAMKMCAVDYKDAAVFFRPTGLGDVTKSLELHSALDSSNNCDAVLEDGKVRVRRKVAAEIRRWKELYAIAYGIVLYAEDVYGGTVG